jgi:hypothetical protein
VKAVFYRRNLECGSGVGLGTTQSRNEVSVFIPVWLLIPCALGFAVGMVALYFLVGIISEFGKGFFR